LIVPRSRVRHLGIGDTKAGHPIGKGGRPGFFTGPADVVKDTRVRATRFLVLVLVVSVFFGACALYPFRKPKPAPEQSRSQPEPTITLFDHEKASPTKVKMERYLEGVVAAEMDPDWPQEALKAQAIIARTFTLKRMDEGKIEEIHGPGVDACTDPQHFQAYDRARVTDRVRRAVQETRGKVVTYQGKPIRAWFHAGSGGRTALPKEGLEFEEEEIPYIRSIEDSASPEQAWTARFSVAEVKRAASGSGKAVGEINKVAIGAKGPSGRALTIKLGETEVSAPRLRIALGPDKMRSTFLTGITMDGSTVVMKGRGYGHGVGLSQVGAKAMAEDGQSAEDVIKFYYHEIKIEQFWD